MNKINTKPIIPVYLNQRIVFDLLAMLEGGISTVERVVSTTADSSGDSRRYGAEFGLSKALSGILKIGVSGERQKSQESEQASSSDREKFHTPASLFYNLRQRLHKEGLVTYLSTDCAPQHQEFVEFTAPLQKNPLVATLDSMSSLMDIAFVFSEDKPKSKGQRNDKQEFKRTKGQIDNFTNKLKVGDTIDIVGRGLPDGYSAVITLETEYLNDPSMSDLVDGRFSVLGKIVREIGPEQEDSISLLRKTALSVMQQEKLEEVFSGFSNIEEFKIPEIQWEVSGPVIQVIPIAIFA